MILNKVMKKILFIIFVLISLTQSINAQATRTRVIYTSGVPAACVRGNVYINVATGNIYTFKTGTGCILSGNTSPSVTVSDTAYDATTWNANTDAATKNAIRDKFESLNFIGWTEIRKSSDQTVTDNVTPQNDTELSFSMDIGGTYVVEFEILYGGNNTTGDYRGRFSFSALANAADVLGNITDLSGGGSAQTAASLGTTTQWPAADRIPDVVTTDNATRSISGRLIITNTNVAANTFQYQFANAAAAAGRNSITKTGSRLRYRKLN
jgi:hypothetical protein